ncbi:hypothetical protein H920_03678 [Fukomys damarensis]|uniref:Uncharacterized protein n=1 Tax=Fukomys damarensis TaxID=885580 RepID=A0A091EHM1_FUKDA|nr:hypothetical protein H920_03678 [Fukomys damarensis]
MAGVEKKNTCVLLELESAIGSQWDHRSQVQQSTRPSPKLLTYPANASGVSLAPSVTGESDYSYRGGHPKHEVRETSPPESCSPHGFSAKLCALGVSLCVATSTLTLWSRNPSHDASKNIQMLPALEEYLKFSTCTRRLQHQPNLVGNRSMEVRARRPKSEAQVGQRPFLIGSIFLGLHGLICKAVLAAPAHQNTSQMRAALPEPKQHEMSWRNARTVTSESRQRARQAPCEEVTGVGSTQKKWTCIPGKPEVSVDFPANGKCKVFL